MRRQEKDLVESVLRAVIKAPEMLAQIDAEAARNLKTLWRRVGKKSVRFQERRPGFQRPLPLSYIAPSDRSRRRAPIDCARYPFKMVEKARQLRENKYNTYQDIADELTRLYAIPVQWGTVRDWCKGHSRLVR